LAPGLALGLAPMPAGKDPIQLLAACPTLRV